MAKKAKYMVSVRETIQRTGQVTLSLDVGVNPIEYIASLKKDPFKWSDTGTTRSSFEVVPVIPENGAGIGGSEAQTIPDNTKKTIARDKAKVAAKSST